MRCARALGVRTLPVDYRAPTANGVKCSVAAGYALEGCCRIGRPSERVRMLPVVLRSLESRLRLPRTRSSAGHESSRVSLVLLIAPYVLHRAGMEVLWFVVFGNHQIRGVGAAKSWRPQRLSVRRSASRMVAVRPCGYRRRTASRATRYM